MPEDRIEPLFNSPVDWDQESYCVERCGCPATHRRLVSMVDDAPVYELVCCKHANAGGDDTQLNAPHEGLGPPAAVGSGSAAAPPVCPMCDEPVVPGGDISPTSLHTPEGTQTTHRSCMLREVVGGIGHLIAHDYWCLEHHDPDAGLTRRQSALLVDVYVALVGVDRAVGAPP